MHRPIKNPNQNTFGFTLIEISIVIIIIGLALATIIPIYNNWINQERFNATEDNMNTVLQRISDYREQHGRLPCPAALTAAPGDINYGIAVPPAACPTAPGVIFTAGADTPSNQVAIGSIPFKTLSLLEGQAYDSYNSRLLYAVTLLATDKNTFNISAGEIDLLDESGSSNIIDGFSNYVILSPGENKNGAYALEGATAGCTGSALEQENCDNDSTFVVSFYSDEIDDHVGYIKGSTIEEWETRAADPSEMILSNANNIAIGVDDRSGETASGERTELQYINADPDSANVRSNQIYSNLICELGAGVSSWNDCFPSNLFGGSTATPGSLDFVDPTQPNYFQNDSGYNSGTSGGVYCPPGQFLIELSDSGKLRCSDEIWLSCPTGQVVEGISGGKVQCAGAPPPGCPEISSQPSKCGFSSDTLEAANHGDWDLMYDGECHYTGTFEKPYFDTWVSNYLGDASNDPDDILVEIQDHINDDGLNDTTLTICNTEPESLIRDAYQCNSGSWQYERTHEIRDHGDTWSTSFDTTNGGREAELPADCTCTEEYRAIARSCPGVGATGTAFEIQKRRCPETHTTWRTIELYTDACGCAAGTITDTEQCDNFFGAAPGSLDDQVEIFKDFTCNGAGIPVIEAPPFWTYDVSDCVCPTASDQIVSKTPCPGSDTNDWDYNGQEMDGFASIEVKPWVCPGTTAATATVPAGTYTSPENPGEFGTAFTVTGPACTCNNSVSGTITLGCTNPMHTGSRIYDYTWDECQDGTLPATAQDIYNGTLFSPYSTATLTNPGSCSHCEWQTTTTAPLSTSPTALSLSPGELCNCSDTSIQSCSVDIGADNEIYNCQCVVQ